VLLLFLFITGKILKVFDKVSEKIWLGWELGCCRWTYEFASG